MKHEGKTMDDVMVGDTFVLADAGDVAWEVTQIVEGKRGFASVRVARLEAGVQWAFATLGELVDSGGPWRRVRATETPQPWKPCTASAATYCTGRGEATCR